MRTAIAVAGTIILLAGLYLLAQNSSLKPGRAAAQSQVFSLVVKDHALSSGPALMQARQGDTITLHVQADQEGELHLHGYELEIKLQPGGEAQLSFVADRAGRYYLHMHGPDGSHAEIATIDIQP